MFRHPVSYDKWHSMLFSLIGVMLDTVFHDLWVEAYNEGYKVGLKDGKNEVGMED